MKVTASKLRENVYRILDQILQTGTPVEIKRKGRTLKIMLKIFPRIRLVWFTETIFMVLQKI